MDGQMSLFALGSCSGKTSPEPFPATEGATSSVFCRNASESRSRPPLTCLCLKRASGQKPGFSWEADFQSLGAYSTRNIGECPNVAAESVLSRILEANPPGKYFLSAKACQGILRRAERRGKELPEPLKLALIRQSQEVLPQEWTEAPVSTEGQKS